MIKPTFFILGAPKCGTTAIAQYLSGHPNILMSLIKEPQYFCRDLNMQKVKTREEYERLFKGATYGHRAIGEASAMYLYSNQAVPNILAEIPDARFIVCLRNPVDMAYSYHNELVAASNEHIKDFSKAWGAQLERQQGKNVSRLCEDAQLLLYGHVCKLGSQLERLYGLCDHRKIEIVFLDDIKSEPEKVYQQVLHFLELPDDYKQDFPVVNAASEWRWPLLSRAVSVVGRTKRRLGIPWIGTGITPWIHQLNRRDSRRAGMTGLMRSELQNYFAEEIGILERITGRNLDHWKL